MMTILSDLRILYHLAFKPVRGRNHAERLESFYGGQAELYDGFRQRLLQGRRELWETLPTPEGGTWVDLGGGTGANLEFFGPRIESLRRLYVVDLSPSLLRIAQERIDRQGWSHVETVEADATTFQLREGKADIVTLSYSLTMIPDWFAVIENVLTLLKPGGLLGVVDFYVSRKYPAAGMARHSWFTRSFWPVWFGCDGVYLSADHVPFLHRRFDPVFFEEKLARVPYLPLIPVPYYCFVGRKPGEAESEEAVQGTAISSEVHRDHS